MKHFRWRLHVGWWFKGHLESWGALKRGIMRFGWAIKNAELGKDVEIKRSKNCQLSSRCTVNCRSCKLEK